MDMFDPRYQLEAEDRSVTRLRAPLSHAEVQQTLLALDALAWRLRRRVLKRSGSYRRLGPSASRLGASSAKVRVLVR